MKWSFFLDRHLMKWSLIVLNINHREFPKECVASISSNKKINNHCRRKSTKKDIMAEYKKYNQWCKGEKKRKNIQTKPDSIGWQRKMQQVYNKTERK